MNNELEKKSGEGLLPTPPSNQTAQRNRNVLLEVLAGEDLNKVAIRYGLSVSEIQRSMSAAFDDIKAADFHKDIRASLVSRIMNNIRNIENWMEKLSPSYKKYHQQLDNYGDEHELWEEVDDHLAFIKFQSELRQQYALLRQILGAELPDERDTTKEDIQRKMMDALSLSLNIVKSEQDRNIKTVKGSIIDVTPESVVQESGIKESE